MVAPPGSPESVPPSLAGARLVGGDVIVDGEGAVHLGRDVIIGSRVRIHTQSGKDVTIGSCVWVGDDVEIMSGVRIHDFAIIAASSRVEADVVDYALIEGKPGVQTWRVR